MATFALLIWPLIAVIIFARSALVPAIVAATVVPYLLLPEAFEIKLPGAPDLDKTAMISVGLVTGLLIYGRKVNAGTGLPALQTADRKLRFLVLLTIAITMISPVITVLNNQEVIVYGPTVLPAMRPWDAIGILGSTVLFLIPFLLAWRYLASPQSHLILLKAFVFSGLVYSVLMLVEIGLGPELHNWVYGFYQHSVEQHIRDGYRPMMFLQHGLWVGFFMFMAVIASAALIKAERRSIWFVAGGWLFFSLMISENLAAFVIAVLCLGALFGFWQKMQIRMVIVIAVATLTYPALRQAELIPLDEMLTAAERVSEERAQSLGFRFDNEDQLLARAYEKPLTGWGTWARDRIYDEDGQMTSITDGAWIIRLGAWGWIGYIGLFGMLTIPLVALVWVRRRKEIPHQTIALALICAGNLVYMIPNTTLTPIGLLCFGALAGFAQFDLRPKADKDVPGSALRRPATLGYTRFPQTARQQEAGAERRSWSR